MTADRQTKPHVLIVSHHFWPESFRINQVAEDLMAAGAEVTVLTGFPGYPSGSVFPGYSPPKAMIEKHPAGFPIFRVPVVPRGAGNAWRLILNYSSFIVSGAIVGAWLLRKRRFDLVFVYCTTPVIQGYLGMWLRLVKRARLVLWIQDLWPQALSAMGFVKSRFLLRIVDWLVSAMYRGSDLIFGQSRAFVAHIGPRAGRTAVRYFPNPGEHDGVPADSPPLLLEPGFNVIFAGNLGKAQALDMVVEAARLLRDDPEIHIVLVGSGAAAPWIAREIDAHRLDNLKLTGRLPPEAMVGVYAQASALLLTLIDDPIIAQTIPSKLQSYLGSGRPVIAAVNGEAARIVAEAGAGLATPAEDAAALADAVRTLKRMPAAERDAMGAAARRLFEAEYEPTKLARQLLETLMGLAAGGRARQRAFGEEPG